MAYSENLHLNTDLQGETYLETNVRIADKKQGGVASEWLSILVFIFSRLVMSDFDSYNS